MKKICLVFPLVLALIIGLMAACESDVDPVNKAKTLTSIEVTTPPDKTEYEQDTDPEAIVTLELEGMVVTATYSDKSTEEVTDYKCSALNIATLGYQDITVTYQKQTATFTVLVKDSTLEDVATLIALPGAGEIPINTRVTLSTATNGAEIWYTTDNSAPKKDGAASTRYTAPIPITAPVTIKAIAVKNGMNASPMLEVAYTITLIDPDKPTVDKPVADPPAGTYLETEITEVTLTTTTDDVEIWYTLDGTAPAKGVAGSTKYEGPIPVTTRTLAIKAIAFNDDMNPSPVLEAAYTIMDAFIHWTVVQSGGVEHKQDTEQLILAFTFDDVPHTIVRGGISIDDISITAGTGSITPVARDPLSYSPGPSRFLTITVENQGTVTIQINKEGFSDKEQTVMVYKKTGYQTDPSVSIADVVRFGTPALPENSLITFARNDGDPIAILPPRTTDPITAISAASPAFEHVIATFATPVDLTTTSSRDFRWIDMIWDGFGKEWDFETESTYGAYTGTRYDLHNVIFQLDLTTTTGARVRLQKLSETNTSNGDKKPVQFLKSDIITGEGNTAWGDGHHITAITLRASGMQLRSPGNTAWPAIGTTRNPIIEDTWISSLTVDARVPSVPYVLYNSTTRWVNVIENPQWCLGDELYRGGGEDATVLPEWTGEENEQKVVYWDPINITLRSTLAGTAPYSMLVISYTGTGSPSIGSWFGYGTISGIPTDDMVGIKQQAFDGSPGMVSNGVIRLPLTGAVYNPNNFDPKQFSGFFLQWDTGGVTITGISLE